MKVERLPIQNADPRATSSRAGGAGHVPFRDRPQVSYQLARDFAELSRFPVRRLAARFLFDPFHGDCYGD